MILSYSILFIVVCMKHMKLFNIILEEINKFLDEKHLDVTDMNRNLYLDFPIPNTKTKVFKDIKIENDSIKVNDPDFKSYTKYDFVIQNDGTLVIGSGHMKLAQNATQIKAAGELILNDAGKIIYLNNESGHYLPGEKNLDDVRALFNKYNLLNKEYSVRDLKYNKY